MRKIYIALLSFLFIFCFHAGIKAQSVGSYVFVPSSGTYTPLTGATTSTATGDDGIQGGIPIGFNFTYGGTVYTYVAVTTNGFIRLGTSAAITINTGLPNYDNSNFGTSTNVPLIAPLWDDNNAGGGSIAYLTSGSVGSRTFSIEWSNIHLGGGGSTGSPTGTFQVTLSETSNFITITYGTINSFTGNSASIGLNDATSFLSVTPGTPATASSAATNNTISTPANLTSGTIYTFFPPPPCVPGSLAGGAAQGPAGTVCPGSNFTLSVTGASFGSGLTYQWEYSSDNTNWNPVLTGGTGQGLTTSVSTNTYFRRKMTCSGTDAWSTSVLVSVTPAVNTFPYLSSFSSSLPSCWSVSEGATGATYHWAPTTADGTHGVNAPQSGSNFAYLYVFLANTPYNPYYLTTTAVALPAVPKQLRYYYYLGTGGYHGTTGATGTDPYPLTVQISTDGGGSWTDLYSHSNSNSTFASSNAVSNWHQNTISLLAYVNQTVIVRFKSQSNYGGGFCDQALDEVVFEDVPACLTPTALTITGSTATTATLSWTAPVPAPANGYQWEVRTSGAGGSGPTGLVTSGTTLAGITSATATGLTANTTYNYYVRSDCGSSNLSSWAGGFVFTTPCATITVPFTETFASYATTFPPTCWTINDGTYLFGSAANAYVPGTGSSEFNYYSAAEGSNLDLISPVFTTVPTGYRVTFDEAYATFFGIEDQLEVLYSTNGGASYSSLVLLTNAELNTGGDFLGSFVPTATQWNNLAFDLPVGTNRLLFRGISGFGNNLFLDNITVEQTPSCLPMTNLSAVGISPTSVVVTFTPQVAGPPGTIYLVEYGAPGFTPGTGATAGVGGVIGGVGPGPSIQVNGLTGNTTYDFYVRRVCVPGVDYSVNKKTTATTLCNATNIPYVQNFESSVVPAPPTCTSVQDLNGNNGSVPNSGGGSWFTYDGGTNPLTYVSPSKTIRYLYDAGNLNRAADDWFYLQGLNLTAGTNYRLKFFIKESDGPVYVDGLEVKYGTQAYSGSMNTTLYSNPAIATALANPFDSVIVDFSPPTTGVFYIGFHAISAANEGFLYLDDVSVKLAPVVDVGVTGLTMPSLNCPTGGVFIQATVKNYNTTTLDFSLHPVTVTANITGPLPASPSTTINTGTLAPGASMVVYLNPAANFTTAGIYNITTTTISPEDPETGNDAYTTSVNVNPNPPTPVITPSPVQLCIGSSALLKTQFVTPPAPPVTLPAVSSGTIAVVVPDGSPVGITNSLAVSSVPPGATLTGISVTLNMTHTYISDMVINLKAPNGNILNLINAEGGSGDNLTNTIISSASTTPISSALPPFTGIFAPDAASGVGPTGSLSNVSSFAGLYSQGNGNWTLAMEDLFGLDIGTLTSWSITLTYQFTNPIVTWSPIAGLFTNAGTTTAYTGGDADSLFTKPNATTTYNVTATTSAGCTSAASVVVTVNPIPVITLGSIPDTVCTSDPIVPLSATPVGGAWSGIGVSGNTFIPPSTAVGTYTLTYSYTSAAGCPATATEKIAVKDCPERIILLRDNAVLLYPNPNNGQFNIKINSVLYSRLSMRVYASNGSLVTTQEFGGLAWGRVIPIDLTNLPSGVYSVEFYYDGGVRTSQKTFKVIVSR